MKPRVTVVLPTYNRMRYLPEAVASVRHQTYRRWELVVIDDGSTDDTSAYLRSLGEQRVRVIASSHSGNPAALRNRGIAVAESDYVAFIDSDDCWLPGKLSAQVDALDRTPEYQWSYTGFEMMDEAGNIRPRAQGSPWDPKSGHVLRDLLTTGIVVPTSSVVVRHDLLQAVGRFDPSLPVAEDLDLWVRLASLSPACALGETLARVRFHGDRLTADRPDMRECKARVFGGVATRSADREVRALCRSLRVHHLCEYAGHRFARGRFRAAVSGLVTALPDGIASSEWWLRLLKVIVRPLTSERMRAWYRDRRSQSEDCSG